MTIKRKVTAATAVVMCLGVLTAGQAFGWYASETGRFAAWADPGSTTGRVGCAHYRQTATFDTGPSGWEMSGRTRTYQGTYPNCSTTLGQPAGVMHVRVRAFRWNPSLQANELYYTTPLATNAALGSVADVADTSPWKAKGTY